MKFVFLVEEHTEKNAIPGFLKRWFDVRLPQPVGIHAIRHDGWAELLRDLPRKVPRYLHTPEATQIIAVVALLDLYGPTIFPTYLTSVQERCDWANQKYRREINEERFRLYFAVHEFEAWLLSEPTLFPPAIANAFPKKIRNPESVNGMEPPAKLLERLYREQEKRAYKKVAHGRELFERLDPNRVYQSCPTFCQMMDELLALAQKVDV